MKKDEEKDLNDKIKNVGVGKVLTKIKRKKKRNKRKEKRKKW